MAELRLSIRSHHFVVDQMTPQGREVAGKFWREFIHYGRRRRGRPYMTAAVNVFAAALANRREFRFHINVLDRFEAHLKASGIDHESLIERVHEAMPVAREIDLPIRQGWNLRDIQVPLVDYITCPDSPCSLFIGLQTGKGKGITSLFGMSRLRLMTVVLVRPRYIEKWVGEIRQICDVDLEDIMVVRGTRHLKALLTMAESGNLHSRIVVISNKTYQRWITTYEEHGRATLKMGYACLPDQLMAWLGAGLRLIDEVHEDFAMQFGFDLYTHCQRSLALSATLLHTDGFLNRMYEIAYPHNTRCKVPAYHRYVRVTALFYRFRRPQRIRCRERHSRDYSHYQFEMSVLADAEILRNYLDLIDTIVRAKFLNNHEAGEKLIIFFSSVELCTKATEYFSARYAHLDVRRYVQGSSLEDVIEPDIRCTTLQSGGTGFDIRNLTLAILTVATAALQRILQSLGRLRELANGRTPEFVCMNCMDLDTHLRYNRQNFDLLKHRALHLDTEYIHTPV